MIEQAAAISSSIWRGRGWSATDGSTSALGARRGARGVLVRTGHGAGRGARPAAGRAADAILDNLREPARWILAQPIDVPR